MSTNQTTRLFIALRELEKLLQRQHVNRDELMYGIGNLRIEVETACRAIASRVRRSVPASNTG